MLRSMPSQQVVGLGLKNIIAIAMPDAVLVIDKKDPKKLKAVDLLFGSFPS